jgi:iron complex outermembrane receptor protein
MPLWAISDDWRWGHGVSRRSATNGADYYLPGYFVADAFAAYKMKLQYPVTLQLNVKNLFDKTYYTSSIATNNLGNQIGDPRSAVHGENGILILFIH